MFVFVPAALPAARALRAVPCPLQCASVRASLWSPTAGIALRAFRPSSRASRPARHLGSHLHLVGHPLRRGPRELRWRRTGQAALFGTGNASFCTTARAGGGGSSPADVVERESGKRSRKIDLDPRIPHPTPEKEEGVGSIGGGPTTPARTRYPLVFAHGLLGFDTLKLGVWSFQYWRGILEALREHGHEVYVTSVPPAASIERRAMELRSRVLEIGAPKVNIIAHSMGGLDSRYFISKLDGADRVASLTTVATPHRGSTFADWCMNRRVEDAFKLLRLMETGAGSNLTTGYLRDEFNPAVPNHPDVKYFSYGAAAPVERLNPVWRISARIIANAEGPNDGLVSVQSATWGEYQGTIECDHLQLLNWAWTNWRGLKFDGLPLYRQIADKLTAEEL